MLSKIFKTLLPVLWMAIIFTLSHQPYDFFIIEATNAQQIVAHIFLYAVLAYLIVFAVAGWEKSWQLKNIILFSIFFSIFYGITDEYHQGFILGRFVSYLDLIFDSLGALLGAFLFYHVKKFSNGVNFLREFKKPKLLLHVCCIGCGAYVVKNLKKDFRVVLYFYNPNVFPKKEYDIRLEQAKKIAKKFHLKLLIGGYGHDDWLKLVKGYEGEPERGRRCLLCYSERLKETAKMAEKMNFNYFTTTLTVSPHKDAREIARIGKELEEKLNVEFLDKDFKKQDGFKKTCELSKKLGLYRQNYCGCEFSMPKEE